MVKIIFCFFPVSTDQALTPESGFSSNVPVFHIVFLIVLVIGFGSTIGLQIQWVEWSWLIMIWYIKPLLTCSKVPVSSLFLLLAERRCRACRLTLSWNSFWNNYWSCEWYSTVFWLCIIRVRVCLLQLQQQTSCSTINNPHKSENISFKRGRVWNYWPSMSLTQSSGRNSRSIFREVTSWIIKLYVITRSIDRAVVRAGGLNQKIKITL